MSESERTECSMVERVAKAKWDHRRAHGKKFGIELAAWEDELEALRDEVRAETRATFEAMREPTDLQCEAARQQTWLGSAMAERVWQAMIDAALIWPAGSADRAGVPMAKD